MGEIAGFGALSHYILGWFVAQQYLACKYSFNNAFEEAFIQFRFHF